ncbi:hypothetical protein [Paraglaciecola sp. MB-3u-78]|uniref:hypothetical protein n=1 Tax=Paraglaciecola sp. MB-3u-78 TaxID=2058332 RepID=UPI001E55A09A|nr:hypothetical protein [Paraglaciecola sp. MB-3u-78]
MFRVIFLGIIFFSSFSYANHPFNVFIKREFNETDSIIGFGATASIGSPNSLLKGELISSFNYAEILDDTGEMQDFLSLDTGVRLGVYGKAFIYIEAGFDTLELFLDDVRDDDNFYDPQENNQIDGYAGLGAGINAENVRIEGFVKARQIDGDYWDSDKQIFYGLQFSLFF